MTMIGDLNKDGTVSNTLIVDFRSIPSDDPIAFGFGFSRGYAAARLDPTYGMGDEVEVEDLAPAYCAGYMLGVGVQMGTEPMPAWCRKG